LFQYKPGLQYKSGVHLVPFVAEVGQLELYTLAYTNTNHNPNVHKT